MTTRRQIVSMIALGGAALALQGCVATREPINEDPKEKAKRKKREAEMGQLKLSATGRGEDHASMYAGFVDGGFRLPTVPYQQIPEQFRRQIVRNSTGYPAGTIVVDTGARHLYLTYPGGQAIRYGVGVGREGFEWSGEAVMQWKREWPKWTPPDEMIARRPDLAKYSAENGGQRPGLDNPLGARAMYIFKDGKDTEFRLHGTPEWKSIGTNASSGCIRLINQDVIDLYARVRGGMKIVVK
ncbi:MAG: L,D-transpeptidase [Rhizobiaceae bacterium]|jgi:lipoprotein-anchoring transpeptidase ErfK/SrfK|nr:L,D-transpeptidase [Rhizobiaceae bacterium]